MRNEGSESETDAKLIRRIMETIQKVTTELLETDIKTKLKEYQGIRNRSYQHQENYIEGVMCGKSTKMN